MPERFFNQKNLLDQNKIADLSFLVIGAGAIGSYTVMGLAKMGAKKITVYDDDTLEEHNFDSQFYPFTSIGKPKVEALKALAKDFGDCDITAVKARWDTETNVHPDVVLVCVDDMDIRKAIWDYFKGRPETRFFVEGRMSSQVYRVYGIQPENAEQCAFYETNLYPQSEASPLPCGEKSIIFTVLQVSAQMCSQVKRWIMGQALSRPTEVQYDCLNDEVIKTNHLVLQETVEEETAA
jgi:molybdopterin/thiamine biosynthesis adenylyltransferase